MSDLLRERLAKITSYVLCHTAACKNCRDGDPKYECLGCQLWRAIEAELARQQEQSAAVILRVADHLENTCTHKLDEDHSHCVRCSIAFEVRQLAEQEGR